MTTQAIPAPTTPTPSPQELFILSDEQILDIVPADSEQAAGPEPSMHPSRSNNQPEQTAYRSSHVAPINSPTGHESRATGHDSPEPPPWLAAQMKDPLGGEEAREFWTGVQQTRQEASACQAYRTSFATPEDARALKELYPGGVTEARAAADRARTLEEIDRAYFGSAGNSPEQLSASRAQLAQRMLHEDPAAFREMVETGIKILQEAAGAAGRGPKTLASLVSDGARQAPATGSDASFVAAQHAAPVQGRQAAGTATSAVGPQDAAQLGKASTSDAQVAAYAAFERAANEDLERSVGGAIERTLAQALPVAQPVAQALLPEQRKGRASSQPASPGAPALHARLTSSVRAEVEKALQGDRQLSEQVAQILSARRFDNESRAQIVRLINDRAQQLVPGAAKRVLNEWTQTTLAAHRGRTLPNEATVDLAPASRSGQSSDWSAQSKTRPAQSAAANRASATNSPRSVNYRTLSDEQILDL